MAFRDMIARIRHFLGWPREETAGNSIRIKQLYEEFGLLGAGNMPFAEEEPVLRKEMLVNSISVPAAAADIQELDTNIRVELLVQLPNEALVWEAVFEIISVAFRNADIGGWIDGANTWINDDIAWIDLTVRVVGLDTMEAVASCTRKLESAGKEMIKSGYRIMDLACTATET